MNKTVNVDKIKHIFIVLVLPTKSVPFLALKKDAIHNIHRLVWPLWSWVPEKLPSVPMRKDVTATEQLVDMGLLIIS